MLLFFFRFLKQSCIGIHIGVQHCSGYTDSNLRILFKFIRKLDVHPMHLKRIFNNIVDSLLNKLVAEPEP